MSSAGNDALPAKLKLYAQVCKHWLGPFLAQQNMDKGLFDTNAQSSSSGVRQPPKSQPDRSPAPPQTPESQSGHNSSAHQNNTDDKPEGAGDSQPQKEATEPEPPEHDNPDAPSIVVYMVDPFTYAQDWDDVNRMSMIGLLRCFQELKSTLPEHIANNIQLQVRSFILFDFSCIATIEVGIMYDQIV